MPRSHHARPRRHPVDGWPTTGRPAPAWASRLDEVEQIFPAQFGLHSGNCSACDAPIHMADTVWHVHFSRLDAHRLCYHCGSCLALYLGFTTAEQLLATPAVALGRYPRWTPAPETA